MLKIRPLSLLPLLLLAACETTEDPAPDAAVADLATPDQTRPDASPPDQPRPDAALPCAKYAQPVKAGTVTLNVLDEASVSLGTVVQDV